MQCLVLSTLRIKKLREFDACALMYGSLKYEFQVG